MTDTPTMHQLFANRRQFLGGAAAVTAIGAARGAGAQVGGTFQHGVASGDPLSDRVMLWTRVSGVARPTGVRWSVATDSAMANVVAAGTFVTDASRDYTVKVDATGLQAGTTYYYRFQVGAAGSPVGRTRTLAVTGVTRAKFAIFSCSAYEVGFFNAYAEAAKIDDLDAVIHLGDYIYEYARGLGLPGEAVATGRYNDLQPKREIVALTDYRLRHATYRTDPDLQAMTARHPLIAVYDDHETANDSYTEGAENHQPATEGPWKAREQAGLKAYYEWMPLRGGPGFDAQLNPQGLYRTFDFGGLARLVMLDTRLAGRDRQLDGNSLIATYGGLRADTLDGTPATRARQLLSAQEALDFLPTALGSSAQTWQVIGNQVLAFYQPTVDVNGSNVLDAGQKALFTSLFSAIFGAAATAQLLALAATPRGIPSPLAADAWTGYPTARAQFLGTLARFARNPIVITGDSHNAWTSNLAVPNPASGARLPVGVEFGGTSVTSGGFESFVPVPGVAPLFGALLVETSGTKSPYDKLIYTNQQNRGFMLLELTPTLATQSHVFVSTITSRSYTTFSRSFTVAPGTKTAVPA